MRIAIVGAGLMGRWHAYAAERAGARVVAVVDSDEARARRLASQYRAAGAFTAFDAALERADVVHICTPPDTHVPLARHALAARRHVLVEKPMAPSAAETEDLWRIAEAHSVLVCPTHQFLFQEGVRAALSSSVPLQHVDFAICSAGADGLNAGAADRLAFEILPHPLSLLMRLRPAFAAAEWTLIHPRAGEIRALAQADSTTAAITVSMNGRPPVNRMRLVGADSTVHADLLHGFAATFVGNASRRQKILQPFVEAAGVTWAGTMNLARRAWRREPAYPGLNALVKKFYEAVRNGGPSPISAEETIGVARTCDGMRGRLASHRD